MIQITNFSILFFKKIVDRLNRISVNRGLDYRENYNRFGKIEDEHLRFRMWVGEIMDRQGISLEDFDIDRDLIHQRIDRIERKLSMRL